MDELFPTWVGRDEPKASQEKVNALIEDQFGDLQKPGVVSTDGEGYLRRNFLRHCSQVQIALRTTLGSYPMTKLELVKEGWWRLQRGHTI
jgi:hypothetical protein